MRVILIYIFFHITTLNRRSQNKIIALQNDEGNWSYNQDKIISKTFNFFKNLFNTQHSFSSWEAATLENPFSQINLSTLGEIPLSKEIHPTVNSFKPVKSLGQDGLHPFFYQKYWNIVGNSIINLCKESFEKGWIPSEINKT